MDHKPVIKTLADVIREKHHVETEILKMENEYHRQRANSFSGSFFSSLVSTLGMFSGISKTFLSLKSFGGIFSWLKRKFSHKK